MSYRWREEDGLITVLVGGQLPSPFLYIDAKDVPPWWVEPVTGQRLGPFESLEAAQVALILSLKEHTNV